LLSCDNIYWNSQSGNVSGARSKLTDPYFDDAYFSLEAGRADVFEFKNIL
jgi:hypothetical protein